MMLFSDRLQPLSKFPVACHRQLGGNLTEHQYEISHCEVCICDWLSDCFPQVTCKSIFTWTWFVFVWVCLPLLQVGRRRHLLKQLVRHSSLCALGLPWTGSMLDRVRRTWHSSAFVACAPPQDVCTNKMSKQYSYLATRHRPRLVSKQSEQSRLSTPETSEKDKTDRLLCTKPNENIMKCQGSDLFTNSESNLYRNSQPRPLLHLAICCRISW